MAEFIAADRVTMSGSKICGKRLINFDSEMNKIPSSYKEL